MGIPEQSECLVLFGPFELDVKNAELRRKGARVPIQPVAFRLLQLLVMNPGELISREEIHNQLWPEEKLTKRESLDFRLNFEIKSIREALAEDHVKARYIQTVRKRGYKFITPVVVKRIESVVLNGAEKNDQEERRADTLGESDNRKVRWRFLTRNIFIVALIALLFGISFLALGSRSANRPVITWVSPILPQPNQTIIIRGHGLGSYTNFTAIDSPFLAIRDRTAHWAAGRIMERNWDKITLTVTRWLNSEIDITGLNGPYGQNGWTLNPGDEIEVAVWNPQTGAGPAVYHLKVSPGEARK